MTGALSSNARPTGASAATLPPAGPAWYGAVMGTGILATLTQTVGPSGVVDAARALLVIGWLLLIGLTVSFATRVTRDREVLAASLRPATLPLWGMVAMGVLSIGSATAAVLPAWWPGLGTAAVVTDGALWVLGSVIGLATTVRFAALLRRTDLGGPTTVWGLAVVPPMVSATVGAGLAPHLPTALRAAMLLVTGLCFLLSLTLGAIIFTVAYHHHWRVAGLPVPASTTAWIPLGVVGQSTAAAQLLAAEAGQLMPGLAGPAHELAVGYGVGMLGLGVPLAGWAVAMTVRGFRRRMPFVPGWWSLTFPIGTLALGSHLLGVDGGLPLFVAAGVACWVTLCGTWLLCAVASVRAVLAGRRQPDPS